MQYIPSIKHLLNYTAQYLKLCRPWVVLRNIECAVNCRTVNSKMAGVTSGSSRNGERGFVPECIQAYRSLPALWDVKAKEYSNRQKKKDAYAVLLDKYRDRYPEANRQDVTKKKKCNFLRVNFRTEMKTTDNSEKRGEGSVFPPSPFTQKVKAKQEASVSLIMMSKLQVIIAQLG